MWNQDGIWETTPEGCAPYLDYAIVLDEEKNEYAVEFKVKQLLDPIEEGEEIGVFFRVIDKLNQGYGSQRSWYAECNPHFKKIFEEHPRINVMHVVLLCEHGNQLITQHKGYNHPGNRHDHRI